MNYFKWVKRGIITLVIAGVAIFSGLTSRQPEVKAGAINSINVSPSNSNVGELSNYTIQFTTSTDLEEYGYVYMVFRGNESGNFSTYASSIDHIYVDGSSTDILEKSYFNGNYLGFKVPGNKTLIGGSAVEIQINSIRNPNQAGGYQLHIYTNKWGQDIDGDYDKRLYLSSTFSIGTITMHGTISQGGTGIKDSYISIYSSNYQNYGYARSDSNGYYELGDSLPSGTYTVSVSPPWDRQDIKRFSGSIELTSANQLYDVALILKTKTISGRVTGDDGSIISNAYIYANQSSTWDYGYDQTDSSGDYSMKLSGGDWDMDLSSSGNGDWVWTGGKQKVSFTDDQTAESQTLNFEVTIPQCAVSGTVVLRDDSGNETAITRGGVSIYQNTSPWSGFYRSLDNNNTFSGKLISGKFKVYPWSSDSSYYLEGVYQQNSLGGWDKLNSQILEVGENDTSRILKIVYLQKTDHITGQIVDENGVGIQGANVYGWKNGDGYDWANVTTDSNGNYDLLVSPGDWQINAYPNWNSGYAYLGKPIMVTVAGGVTSSANNFSFLTLNATVNGTVVDTDGTILSDLHSWAYIDTSDLGVEYWYSNVGSSVTNGKFSMRVPAGTHKITVGWGGDSYSPGDPTEVTVAASGTAEINVVMLKKDATITGYLKDTDGNAITGQYAWISATNNRYGWASGSVDTATGQYTMAIAAGTWHMSYWMDYNSGYASQLMDDNKVVIASGETIVKDITLRKIDSQITGTVKKYDGTAMENIPVSFDTRSGKKKTDQDSYMWYYASTDWTDYDGNFTLDVPAGTYYVNASLPYWQLSNNSLITPEEQQVTVDSSNSAAVNLVFREVDSQISGSVSLDGNGTTAYIWAWADKGGGSQANAGSDGSYATNATKNDVWHIGAVKESSQAVYMSSEYLVETEDNASIIQDLALMEKDWSLPDSISVTFDPTKLKNITMSDNTNISIPANAAVSDPDNPSATVTFTATPRATLPAQKGDKPLWYGYDFTITEPDGTQVTSFNSPVTISFPFTDDILATEGLTSDDLTLKFYNETTGDWDQVSNVIIDADNKIITISVDHFTIFAITTDVSDTTAPSAPTGVSATTGDTKATLNWTNPTDADFASIKIYRSTSSGVLGDAITTISSTSTTSYENTGLTNGTTYYYTVRALDTSDNESVNTDQVSAAPSGTVSVAASVSSSVLPETGMEKIGWREILKLSVSWLWGKN